MACTQVIMSDIRVEEEVIVIDIEKDNTDDSYINTTPRAGAGGDPLDGNGNDNNYINTTPRADVGGDPLDGNGNDDCCCLRQRSIRWQWQ